MTVMLFHHHRCPFRTPASVLDTAGGTKHPCPLSTSQSWPKYLHLPFSVHWGRVCSSMPVLDPDMAAPWRLQPSCSVVLIPNLKDTAAKHTLDTVCSSALLACVATCLPTPPRLQIHALSSLSLSSLSLSVCLSVCRSQCLFPESPELPILGPG